MSGRRRGAPQAPQFLAGTTLASSHVALYCRVSTEDQAERQTVRSQLDFLHKLADLHGWPVAGEYVDDGESGTVPLAQRPAGARLLTDAAAGHFGTVLFYRLDRLGRKVQVLLGAHEALEAASVTLKSATEPFDTSSPLGRFVFQLLGSIAELEKDTIIERMTLGRDQQARKGRWLGVVPFGYDVDPAGHLVPSERFLACVRMTEAALVRRLYRRLANGSTLLELAVWLNRVGVPCVSRYTRGRVLQRAGAEWRPGRVRAMLRNTVYRGVHVYQSHHGPIERSVPALVTTVLWTTVQEQLRHNRDQSRVRSKGDYLLRGLLRCADCGQAFCGGRLYDPQRPWYKPRYYRCWSQLCNNRPLRETRCQAKILNADSIEAAVWSRCAAYVRDPEAFLIAARAQLRSQQEHIDGMAMERQGLQLQLSAQAEQRRPVLDLLRKSTISSAEAEQQLNTIKAEMDATYAQLTRLDAQAALVATTETQLTEAATLLARMRDQVDEIERTNDRSRKRQILEFLVAEIRVQTYGTGRAKRAETTALYHLGPPQTV
jgi:site-specific DNA recombinase